MVRLNSTYDFVIVGAGSAGCVLAYRLSEDPGRRVLLIEAGGRDLHPYLRMPKAAAFAMADPKLTWQYETEPFGPQRRVETWARGRVLGGSSSINGMVYNRGQQADFDALEPLGISGWSWERVLAAYRALEDHALGESDVRGHGGPLKVGPPRGGEPVCDRLLEAASRLGLSIVDDVNATDAERIGYTVATIRHGLRVSSASAFLRPARARRNLTVVTKAHAVRVNFTGSRATGVRVRIAGGERDVHAAKEVILAAGSLASPQLLELSGIGSRDVLADAKVDVRVESPRIGEGIREHRCITLSARLTQDLGYDRLLGTLPRQGATLLSYLATRKGPLATAAYDLIAFLRSTPNAPRPDGQILLAPFARTENGKGLRVERSPGVSLLGFALRPTSEGSSHIRSSNAMDSPRIRPSYLATDHDRTVTVALFHRMREILRQPPMASLVERELVPGDSHQSDEAIIASAFTFGGTGYHASGSCAMGAHEDDPVDTRMRVRGVERLRVVDGSVLPAMLSGNLNAPIMAMAWLAAELIVDDNS